MQHLQYVDSSYSMSSIWNLYNVGLWVCMQCRCRFGYQPGGGTLYWWWCPWRDCHQQGSVSLSDSGHGAAARGACLNVHGELILWNMYRYYIIHISMYIGTNRYTYTFIYIFIYNNIYNKCVYTYIYITIAIAKDSKQAGWTSLHILYYVSFWYVYQGTEGIDTLEPPIVTPWCPCPQWCLLVDFTHFYPIKLWMYLP